jgi:hypothetical protein
LDASGSCLYPSNSGSRDQEDHDSKPAWTKSLQDPILKKTLHEKRKAIKKKKAGRVAQGIDSDFKPQYCKKNRKKKKIPREAERRPCDAESEGETGRLHLQAKECQGLLSATSS